MSTDVETIVIGAGVVGLAVAGALARDGHEVLVLERHGRAGMETSARSSEVIHAGLYYPVGSLKARLCVKGNALLYRFAAENGVLARRLGKLLVATTETEVPALEAIAACARANGVRDLERLTPAEAAALEPELACVAAYLSPSTGVIDSHALLLALEGHLASEGGRVVLATEVAGFERHPDGAFVIEAMSGGKEYRITASNLVIAAGLSASRLARMLPVREPYRVPETYYAKGHYYGLAGPAPFSRLVYPMPARGSLGIHFTLDASGAGKFGPDIHWTGAVSGERPDYTFDEENGARLERFEASIRRYWPGLPSGALTAGYTGIRPKLTREGEPAADFAIDCEREHGIARLVLLLGIESPGLTSSLALAEEVARRLTRAR